MNAEYVAAVTAVVGVVLAAYAISADRPNVVIRCIIGVLGAGLATAAILLI